MFILRLIRWTKAIVFVQVRMEDFKHETLHFLTLFLTIIE